MWKVFNSSHFLLDFRGRRDPPQINNNKKSQEKMKNTFQLQELDNNIRQAISQTQFPR